MKFLFVLSMFLSLSKPVFAQTDWLWTKSAGSKGSDQTLAVSTDNAGNVYAAGFFSDSANFSGTVIRASNGAHFFLAKYSSDGTFLWVKTSFAKGHSFAMAMTIAEKKYIYIAGYFSGSLVFGADTLVASGAENMFIAKYSLDGGVLWAKTGGAGAISLAKGIAADHANIYVTGSFSGTAAFGAVKLTSVGTNDDIFVAKYDTGGSVLWAKSFGAAGDDEGYGIATAVSGNIAVTGSFSGTVDFGGKKLTAPGQTDIYIAKYSPEGNLIWAVQANDSGIGTGAAIVNDREENIYVTGDFNQGAAPGDCDGFGNIYIAKFSSDGTKEWSKCAGEPGSESGGFGMALDSAGNIFVTGGFDASADFGTGLLQISGISDLFAVKYSPAGVAQWSDRAGKSGTTYGTSIALSLMGDLFLGGYFTDTVMFENFQLASAGQEDIVLAKIGAKLGVPVGSNHDSIILYPNPASDEVHIEDLSGSIGKSIEIFSLIGERVKTMPIAEGKRNFSFSVKELPAGIYFCRIEGSIQKIIAVLR